MLQIFSQKSSFRSKPLSRVASVVIGQSAMGYSYVLASPKSQHWQIEKAGLLRYEETVASESTAPETMDDEAGEILPDWEALLDSAWRDPDATSIRNRRFVLSVQRPDIDFISFEMPDDPQSDLTESVYNELTLRENVVPDDMVIDYCRQTLDPDRPLVFAAAVPQARWNRWIELAKLQNRKIDQVFVRPLATAQLVKDVSTTALDSSCLLLAIYDQQADLILLHQRQPCFVRSLFLQNPESIKASVAQLVSEIRLSLSTIDFAYLDEALSQAVVMADPDFATELIVQLKIDLDINGTRLPIEDLPGFEFSGDQELTADLIPLLGALQLQTQSPGQQTLDLMNPKQPVEPPSMIRRIALLSTLLLIVAGYFMMNWYDAYQKNHADMSKMVLAARKEKKQYEASLPDAQISQFVQRWQKNEIQWLKQLEALTSKLPSGDRAVIRQFSGSETAEGASISMQIHVSDLETSRTIQQTLEDSGMQIQLKRVVETADQQYPFRLETTLVSPRISREPPANDTVEDAPADSTKNPDSSANP